MFWKNRSSDVPREAVGGLLGPCAGVLVVDEGGLKQGLEGKDGVK